MDLGSDLWLVIALALPLLAIIAVLLLKQRAKPSKNVRIAPVIIAIVLLAAYLVWRFYSMPD
jgi:multidrug transporter EmrE-like cation transporter